MANKSTRWKYYQPNKKDIKDEYGDCVIRALTKALGMEWLEVFDDIQPISRELQVPFNCKPCYERYLAEKGYIWKSDKVAKGKKKLTPQTFYKEHPTGTYILRQAHHLVTVVDGYFYDTWDSGDRSVYGYWVKEDK